MSGISWKIALKTPDPLYLLNSDDFIVNFEHIQHVNLLFLFLTLNLNFSVGG